MATSTWPPTRATCRARWRTSSSPRSASTTPSPGYRRCRNPRGAPPPANPPAAGGHAPGPFGLNRTAGPDGGGQLGQDAGGGAEVHARVGDALPVGEVLRGAWFLLALDQEALQHHPGQAALAGPHLFGDGGSDHGLAPVVLAA